MITIRLRSVLALALVAVLLLTGVSCASFDGKPKAREAKVAAIAFSGGLVNPSFNLSLHPDPCLQVTKTLKRKSEIVVFPLSSEEYKELHQLWQAAHEELKTVKQRTDIGCGANIYITLQDQSDVRTWVTLLNYAETFYDLPALEKLQTKLKVHYPHFF